MLETARKSSLILPQRLRRLRRTGALRAMVRETTLSPSDFIYPLFIVHGHDVREAIPSMPGQFHLSLDQLPAEAAELGRLQVPAVLLFGLPATKDPNGSEAYARGASCKTRSGRSKRLPRTWW